MKEKYLALLKKSLLSPNNQKTLFFDLLKHFEIKKLKQLPDFNSLKNFVISLNITSEEIYGIVAIKAVKNKKLDTLKFLIEECGYDLKETADPDGITLLHEACLRGANEMVEYLLQKGFNPNAKDWQGETPLHRVVQQEGNTSLIATLKKYRANLNIENQLGLTPLFTAILYNNSTAHTALLKLITVKAAQKMTCSLGGRQLSYSQFKQEVGKGNIENASPIIDLSLPEISQTEQAVVNYWLGCLLPRFNQQIFQEVKASLTKSSKPLNKDESHCLINTVIVTSKMPFQPKILIGELLGLIQKDKLMIEFAVSGLLNAARNFAEQNELEIVAEINEFVLEKLESKEIAKEIAVEEVVTFYYVLGVLYKRIGLFTQSEHCLQQSIQNLSEQRTDKDKAEIFFNLACTQAFLMKRKEALESFKKAFYFDQTDEESFQHYLTYLLEFKRYEEALQVCNESSFNEYSKICTAYIYTLKNQLTWLDLLKAVDAEFSSRSANLMALDLKATCYIELRNPDQAIITINESLAIIEKNFKEDKNINIASGIFKVLYIYLQAGAYKLGLELVERFEKEYPLEFGYSVLCSTVAAVFYLVNQQFDRAEALTQKIRISNANLEMLAHLYLLIAIEIASHNNPDTYGIAMKYIDLTLEIEPNHFKAQFYKLLLSILQKDQTDVKDILQNIELKLGVDTSLIKGLLKEKEPISLEAALTHIVDTSEIKNLQEADDFILEEQISRELEEYDPVKIHRFFQEEKTRLLNETVKALSKNPKPKTTWKVGHICFEEGMEGLIRIQHPRFSNCYAIIHPDFVPPFLEEFKNALSKSNYDEMELSENTHKIFRKVEAGVQTENGRIIKLKIPNKNNRLWANKIYYNSADDKYLIVFKEHAYHKELGEKSRKGPEIEVIDVSKELSLLNPGNISGVFVTPPAGINLENKQPVDVTNTLQI